MSQSESTLYKALKEILRVADQPLSPTRIFEDHLHIREQAASTNRVSDYLGNLWRKGDLSRIPNHQTEEDRSRWAYTWRQRKPGEQVKAEKVLRTVVNRPEVVIKENGRNITIELPDLTITINVKN